MYGKLFEYMLHKCFFVTHDFYMDGKSDSIWLVIKLF